MPEKGFVSISKRKTTPILSQRGSTAGLKGPHSRRPTAAPSAGCPDAPTARSPPRSGHAQPQRPRAASAAFRLRPRRPHSQNVSLPMRTLIMNHSMAPPRTKKKGSRRYAPSRSRPGTNRSRRFSRRLTSMAGGSPTKRRAGTGALREGQLKAGAARRGALLSPLQPAEGRSQSARRSPSRATPRSCLTEGGWDPPARAVARGGAVRPHRPAPCTWRGAAVGLGPVLLALSGDIRLSVLF